MVKYERCLYPEDRKWLEEEDKRSTKELLAQKL